jgi:fructose-1,6-bisphosphatase I
MQTSVYTIERHIVDQERKFPGATGHLTGLLLDIALAAKIISVEVNKAGLAEILGKAGYENIQGEVVQKLDVYAQETMYNALDHTGHLCAMASEEKEDIIPIPEEFALGKYVINFDPLDGSSNIEANVSIGTIFSIHRRISPAGRPGTPEDCMQPGYKQVCAGYVVYGSSTMMVYSTGQGVFGFTLDPSIGEFLLSHENIKMPNHGNFYSVNEGYYHRWDKNIQELVEYYKTPDKETKRPYKARYIGSLVADFHRNLLYGGIFMYPPDSAHPHGKLRLLYEAAPLAFIAEQAGGAASTGCERILDVQPKELHQRVPLFIGNKRDVEIAEKFIKGEMTKGKNLCDE